MRAIILCLICRFLFAYQDEELAQLWASILDINQPTIEDYERIETYLSTGERPYLDALRQRADEVDANTRRRLNNLLNFKLLGPNRQEPVFEVHHLNGGVDRIDYLKIDAEGAELLILKGAEGLFRQKAVMALQFEYGGCYRDSKTTLKEVMQLLTDAGFVLFRMVPSGLMHIAAWHPALENYGHSNFFAILQEEAVGYGLAKMKRSI